MFVHSLIVVFCCRLMQVLQEIMKHENLKTLIFVETKRKADELTRQMRRDGWPALAIHGDKQQSEREYVLNRVFCYLCGYETQAR